jgi:hypothetical protein
MSYHDSSVDVQLKRLGYAPSQNPAIRERGAPLVPAAPNEKGAVLAPLL